ncbi:MAG TPA: hypothetical protein VIL88_08875 [Devosia sp.]|jgi:plasmid stability protein|uniref:hypothetical protein n=1 Tax=Devosia sp. TaxID=1871048 RepID=UPI002F927A5F
MDQKIELDLEADDRAALEERASANGRSVAEEAAAILHGYLHVTRADAADLIAQSRALRAMARPGVAQTDSLLLLREDRNR